MVSLGSSDSAERNTAPLGALMQIRPLLPLRPINRTVIRTPATSTVLDSPSAYQSMHWLVGATGAPHPVAVDAPRSFWPWSSSLRT